MLATTKPVSHRLPFVSNDGETTNFWNPDRGGEYEVACARGRRYAEELLEVIRLEENPTLFGTVLRAIVAGRVYGGVEIGFCHRLGIELLGL